MEKEIWKDLKSYEGFYQISNTGKIKGLERTCKTKGNAIRKVKEKLLNLFLIKGYYYVTLNRESVMDQFRINVLVGKTFIPNPDNLEMINHKDCNKRNNHIDNLEWCTHQQNMKQGVDNKLFKGRLGEKHHNHKLFENDIIEIRKRLTQGNTGRSIAKDFKMSEAMISLIKHNKNWKL